MHAAVFRLLLKLCLEVKLFVADETLCDRANGNGKMSFSILRLGVRNAVGFIERSYGLAAIAATRIGVNKEIVSKCLC